MSSTSKKDLFGTTTLAEKLKVAKESLSKDNVKQEHPAPKPNVEPKLFVSGRLDRKTHKYAAHSLVLPKEIELEIKACCRGSELPVLNYLISQGLKTIKESKEVRNIDAKDIYLDL